MLGGLGPNGAVQTSHDENPYNLSQLYGGGHCD